MPLNPPISNGTITEIKNFIIVSLEKFSELSDLYASAMGIDLANEFASIEKKTSTAAITAKEWDLLIPAFLRRKDWQ